MTKALFFDIDGTLVSFHTHRIPSSTIEALEAAHTKGHKIFIATGRPKAIINNLSELQKRNLIDGYITMNGRGKSNGRFLRKERSTLHFCRGTSYFRLPAQRDGKEDFL